MHKISLYVILSILLVGIVYGDDGGFYIVEDDVILNGSFSYSDVTHLRDGYYGVVYSDASDDGQLLVIELDETNNIINYSVDTWEFDTTQGLHPTILNFNNETGLSAIVYAGNDGAPLVRIKSFDMYSNGTINVRDVEYLENFHLEQYYPGAFKVGNDSFLVGALATNVKERYQMAMFTIDPSGTLTNDGTNNYCIDKDEYGSPGDLDVVKANSYCYMFYKRDNDQGYYDRLSCTDYAISGGVSILPSCTVSTTYSSQFEGNEIYYISADANDDFIFIVYAETISKYPVISTRDGSTAALLDKVRISTDTISSIDVMIINSNSVLVVYETASGLEYKTFSISVGGDITEEYSEELVLGGSAASLSTIHGSEELFISSYTGSSGDVIIFGGGIPPLPEPEDTVLTIKDERTLDYLDFTDLNLTFEAHCADKQNYQDVITENSTEIPVDCDYESFAIKVEFYDDINISYNYRRYYLRDLDAGYNQFDLDVYLINPYDTDFVYNEIIVDDLKNKYVNAQIFFEKNINGNTTQITAYDLDIQNSMMAILMNGEQYDVYVDADGISKEYLGEYISPRAGIISESTTFHLYDVILKADFTNLANLIQYQIYVEDYNIEYNIRKAEGVEDNLINTTFYLYEGTSETGTLIYNESVGLSEYDSSNLYGFLSGGPFNYSEYENKTVYGRLEISFSDDGQIRQVNYEIPLWVYNKLNLPLTEYVSQGFIDWFILILISVIALYATIQTANIASIAIVGIASLFVMFGWFSVGSGALALAALISIISLLTKKEKEAY